MTSPLPAQHSKSALEESKNSQKGGISNFCATPKSKETASFESLIEQNDQRQERADELEEAEAAKKRRKALDADAIAAQATNSGNIQSEAHLDLAEGLGPQPKVESTSKNASAEQSGGLPSKDGNQSVQDAQINTPEINPSITSTSRLPKLEATKANVPLPGNTTEANNTPSLPITDNLPLQPTNPAEKSDNTVQTELTNLITLTEELLNAESQATIDHDFNAFAASANQTSLPASPEPQNSNPTPSQQIDPAHAAPLTETRVCISSVMTICECRRRGRAAIPRVCMSSVCVGARDGRPASPSKGWIGGGRASCNLD